MSTKHTRNILQDPVFGLLDYHSTLNKPKLDFRSHERLCHHPFTYVEVRQNGDINICCPQWNPASIGNVLSEDLKTIWNGKKAQLIRDSILDSSYRYCNSETCPNIQNWQTHLMVRTPEKIKQLINGVRDTPQHVHFVVDRSCNLSCPSCRLSKLTQLDHAGKQQALNVIRNVLNSMFETAHNDHKIIGMDGSGEIFSSEVYREVFETEEVFTNTEKWPNLRFAISTNGTMMTEKNQKKYNKIFAQLAKIEISIDAGNKESYETVRVGGQWDLLWKNLDYLYATIKDKKTTRWVWNLIVQKNNFESIPEFVALANKYHDYKPELWLTSVLNWGTWSDTEYQNLAVHLPSHPLYSKYLEIMNLPEVKNYKNSTI